LNEDWPALFSSFFAGEAVLRDVEQHALHLRLHVDGDRARVARAHPRFGQLDIQRRLSISPAVDWYVASMPMQRVWI